MVTKVPLFASQTPSNAVRAEECCGWEMDVLMLLSILGGCGVSIGCVTSIGGGYARMCRPVLFSFGGRCRCRRGWFLGGDGSFVCGVTACLFRMALVGDS